MTTTLAAHPSRKVRWGLLAAGTIATTFAEALGDSDTAEVVAVAARSGHRAAAFAARHDIPRSYEGYWSLLQDPGVDVVYLSTPHPAHAEWAIAGLEAGKHVLCEKPLALNVAQAEAIVAAAARSGRFLMEGFMYRFHPQTLRLLDLITQGAIGEVQAIDIAICFGQELSSLRRLIDPELGGGAILDVGAYCVSVARTIAGLATDDEAPVEPIAVHGAAVLDRAGAVDLRSLGVLQFDSGIVAQLAAGVRTQPAHHVRVIGTDGELAISSPPWLPAHHAANTTSEIRITDRGHPPKTVTVTSPKPLFAYEAEHVAQHLGDHESPILSWAETLANMRTLDRWRASIGLTYAQEA